MQTDLITISKTPAEIFVPQGLNSLIEGVRDKVREFQALNLTTERKKDRDKIKSFAMKITKTKTFIDKARLAFVKDRKALLKVIDSEGKNFRDTLDEIKNEVRLPLTAWEDEEKIRVEKELELELFNIDHADALGMDDIFNREKAIEAKELAFAKIEEEKREKEEAERLEKEQKEREERIKKEAAEEAIKATEDAAAEKAANALRKEKGARGTAKKLEEERIEAEKQEQIRIKKEKQDKIEAKEKAEKDKKAAVQKAKVEFAIQAEEEKKEAERKMAKAKAAEDAKAANVKHRATVNNKIMESLSKVGVPKMLGKKIIIATVKGQIEGLNIKY